MPLRTAIAVNPRRSCAAYRTARTGNAARANVTPMRLTGRLWKLRAWSTTVTLPAAIVDARLVKKMNSKGSSGPPAAFGSSSRKNSRIAAVRRCSRGHGRKVVRVVPMSRMPRCIEAPRIAPTAGAKMPISSTSSTVPMTIPRLYSNGAAP